VCRGEGEKKKIPITREEKRPKGEGTRRGVINSSLKASGKKKGRRIGWPRNERKAPSKGNSFFRSEKAHSSTGEVVITKRNITSLEKGND